MRRHALLGFVTLVLVGCLWCPVCAQESGSNPNPYLLNKAGVKPTKTTGIITDRLAPKDLQRWSEIERLVFAEQDGQYLHPTLRGLWEWLETSGHAVFIEFLKPMASATSTAGHFKIEKLDARGERHAGIIQLNLSNIDLAYVGRETWRTAGFIPFDQLSREERYAEVLGHEMAHAADILTSLEKTAKVDELVEQTNAMLLHHRSLKPTEQLTIELKNRLNHRDAILSVLEATAEKMEAQVWRELVASKAKREKAVSLARK